MHTETDRAVEDEDTRTDVEYSGAVRSGMGKGRQFVSLPGYEAQFREQLGYEPFYGTLNVALTAASTERRPALEAITPIRIDGWSEDGRTFGPVNCYPATVETTAGECYEPTHVIVPERTDHDDDQLEVIAPEELRDRLALTDGDSLAVRVGSR